MAFTRDYIIDGPKQRIATRPRIRDGHIGERVSSTESISFALTLVNIFKGDEQKKKTNKLKLKGSVSETF